MKPTTTSPLEWSGEILQEIFRHTPVGVLLTDLHGTILDLNEALCVMIGHPREQVIGQTALAFLHPDEEGETIEFLSKVRDAAEGSRRAVRRIRSRSGKTIWANITLSVVHSRDDEPIFGLAFVEDITERLQMDEALRRTAALYRQVVEDQTEMIVRWTPDGTRTFVNEAYARYFGFTESELIGTSFFPLIVKEDLDYIKAKIASLTPGEPVRTALHRVIAADASVRWNEWTDRATFDEEGRITVLQSIGRDVTEQVNATEGLRVSESRYRRLFENLPIAAWEVDWSDLVTYLRSEGLRSTRDLLEWAAANAGRMQTAGSKIRVLEVNERAIALGGVRDRPEFERWLPTSFVPGSVERVLRAVGAVILEGSDVETAEITIETQAGRMRDILICWNRVRQHGSGWTLLNTAVDLTERKQSERELRRSEQLYRDLFHNLPVAVWETDWSEALAALRAGGITTAAELADAFTTDRARLAAISGLRRIVEANQNALRLMGVSTPEELLKATWPPKVAPDQLMRFVRTLATVVFGEAGKAAFELQITRPDGSTVDVDALICCSDAAPGQVVSTAIDVTERKQIERDLLHSQLLLERAQAIAHLGSWEISIEHDELFGSREYWNLVDGNDSSGPRTRKLSETLQVVHPDDRDEVWEAIVRAQERFAAGFPAAETIVQYRVVRPDGTVRTMRGQGLFSHTPAGDIRGYGIVQDITEILRAEEAVQQQREELMRADRMISLGVLVSGVAHEVNNPNQFIMLNAPFLQSAWKDVGPVIDAFAERHPEFRVSGMPWSEMRQEIPDIFAEIERGSERIRSIVSELRTFGRDHGPLELRPSSVNEIIEGSLRLLSTHIRRATSNFAISLAPGLPLIAANRQRLEQVILNLVLNSCQAVGRPDAAIRVVTSWHEPARAVRIEVVDEGQGISAENLAKIRDPFFTTKRAEGGMGLGLAVSDRIVQEHNGTLTFESEPGRGTKAILSFPALSNQEH